MVTESEPKQPAHQVIFNAYLRILDDEMRSTSILGVASTSQINLCEEILRKSQIPSEEIPSMLQELAQRQEQLSPNGRSMWERELYGSLDKVTNILTPPDTLKK